MKLNLFQTLGLLVVLCVCLIAMCQTCEASQNTDTLRVRYRAVVREIWAMEKDTVALRNKIERECPLRFEPIRKTK